MIFRHNQTTADQLFNGACQLVGDNSPLRADAQLNYPLLTHENLNGYFFIGFQVARNPLTDARIYGSFPVQQDDASALQQNLRPNHLKTKPSIN